MENVKANLVLDAKGLACPMPIVKTKKTMNDLQPGEVLEVMATDKGSLADLKAWSEKTGHQYIGTVEKNDVLHHFIRKSTSEEKVEKTFETVISNEKLLDVLDQDDTSIILDVREHAEYAFAHIPGAISIPLGELESRINELSKEQTIYVVCRTGNRSDMAAQKLVENGFSNVTNVVPGMSNWSGSTKSDL